MCEKEKCVREKDTKGCLGAVWSGKDSLNRDVYLKPYSLVVFQLGDLTYGCILNTSHM